MRTKRRKLIDRQLCCDHSWFFIIHSTEATEEEFNEYMLRSGAEVFQLDGFRIISSVP